ncbi:MAG: DUF5107 domain-containing protein [Cytophagales bacterium]|nr:DUF5107 domain-containing protein [Cytophagales bacterium]
MELKVSEFSKTILTHQLTPTGPLPAVLDPDGVYPYQSFCETSTRPVLKKYDMIKLENAYLSVIICPDLGGKVYSIFHKESGREILYVPDVIRASRILPRFSFVAGGIEVSFPISHTPSQNEIVCCDIHKGNDRIYVAVGEREIKYGMQWTVEYSLGQHDRFITQRTVFKNPTQEAHPWMSWSNAAVPAFEDTEFHFPGGTVLMHSDALKTIDWESEGPTANRDIRMMTGYFWLNPDVNAFGCYSCSNKTGLYHTGEREQVPGIKLWSYGCGRDLDWAYAHALKKQPYLEIQAGPIIDQSVRKQLPPGQVHQHTEYWFPTDKKMDIRKLKVPEVNLRDISEIPLFSFARKNEVEVWQSLVGAYEKTNVSGIPVPPDVEDGVWPPGGLPNLGAAFEWVIECDRSAGASIWQLYYGVWLLAENRIDEGIRMLSESGLDMACAVLGRVYFRNGKFRKAASCYDSLGDEAFKNHPQVVVERDRALAEIGPETLKKRMYWLDEVNALDDDFIIERRVDMLIDLELFDEARALLLETGFQKVHQRYERKKLWERLCFGTNRAVEPYPANLGEDGLAKFGTYREFDEK